MGQYVAYAAGGIVFAGLAYWWFTRQQAAKEQADMDVAGLKAQQQGQLAADEAAAEAKKAADEAKKGNNANPFDM